MKTRKFIDYLLILILGIIVYFNSFWVNFIWDDFSLILNNSQIKNFSNALKIFSRGLYDSKAFYRPMQTLSYMLDFFLYKLNYKGYHLTNILLHILAVILAYKLLLILTKNRRLSLFASLLYLVSPLWVESVTYISGRADILMAIFILLSFIFFIKDNVFLSIIFYIFALLSKEASLIFPLVLILYLFLLGKKERKPIYTIITFFIIDIGYIALRTISVGYQNINFQKYPFYGRILFFIKAVPKYISLLFFPHNQHMAYTLNLPVSFFEKEVWLSFIFIIFLGLLFFCFLKKERFISFFIAWFFIFLLPHSGIFPINAFFAEHFIYIAALGIFVIFIYFLEKLKPKIAFSILFLAFLSFFSLATVKYNFIWQDSIKFYKRIIGLSPSCFTAYNNLGGIYLNDGKLNEAERLIKKSLELNPQFIEARLNLAHCYYLKQDFPKAIDLVKGVLAKEPSNPSYIPLQLDLYSSYKLLGKEEEAGRALEQALFTVNEAIKINPRDSSYYNLKGVILKKNGDYTEALDNFKMALKISPSDYEAYNNLGILFAALEDFNNAEKNFQKAISLNKNYAEGYFNLGIFYFKHKNFIEAKKMFEKTILLDSHYKNLIDKYYLK